MNIKFHTIESIREDRFGIPPSVSEYTQLVEVNKYEQLIGKKQFEFAETIKLELDRWIGRKMILRDYHIWQIGRPEGYHIVCSKKFKLILETLNLPDHRFYNAEIFVNNKKNDFFLLHFIHNWQFEIDYSSSQFKIIDFKNDKKILKLFGLGEIRSKLHYDEIVQLLVDAVSFETVHILYPKKLVFQPQINYDVWGLHGQIVLSAHAKEAIEAAGITGLAMPPVTDNPIFADLEVIMGTRM